MGRFQRTLSQFLKPSAVKHFPENTLFTSPANVKTTASNVSSEQPHVSTLQEAAPFSPRSPHSDLESSWITSTPSVRAPSSTLQTQSSDLCSSGEWVDAPDREVESKEGFGMHQGAAWRKNAEVLNNLEGGSQKPQVTIFSKSDASW